MALAGGVGRYVASCIHHPSTLTTWASRCDWRHRVATFWLPSFQVLTLKPLCRSTHTGMPLPPTPARVVEPPRPTGTPLPPLRPPGDISPGPEPPPGCSAVAGAIVSNGDRLLATPLPPLPNAVAAVPLAEVRPKGGFRTPAAVEAAEAVKRNPFDDGPGGALLPLPPLLTAGVWADAGVADVGRSERSQARPRSEERSSTGGSSGPGDSVGAVGNDGELGVISTCSSSVAAAALVDGPVTPCGWPGATLPRASITTASVGQARRVGASRRVCTAGDVW